MQPLKAIGRMVLNVEPNTTKDFSASPSTDPSTMKAWRYAYDRLGQLVGTSDARGCGTNFYYLADGRTLGEDYSPAEHAISARHISADPLTPSFPYEGESVAPKE